MSCDKEGYTKGHAEQLRKNIYQKSRRNTKLRIYYCRDCFKYHLTSSIKGEAWED